MYYEPFLRGAFATAFRQVIANSLLEVVFVSYLNECAIHPPSGMDYK